MRAIKRTSCATDQDTLLVQVAVDIGNAVRVDGEIVLMVYGWNIPKDCMINPPSP